MTKKDIAKLEEEKAAQDKRTIDNLNYATDAMDKTTVLLKGLDDKFAKITSKAAPEDQQKAAKTVNKVKQLLAELKAGGNIDNIVKEINKLR